MARIRTNYDETLARYLRTALLYTWRRDSVENCDEKCVITGRLFDVVHHLYPCNLIIRETMENLDLPKYNTIKDYTEEELSLVKEEYVRLHYSYGLGVCLTNEIHDEFHRLMGLNAKPDDFELYKYYKLNNLDLDEIAKCDLSDNRLVAKEFKIYKREIEYIMEMPDINFNVKNTLFTMLALSKIYGGKDGAFYASFKKISDYTPFTADSAYEHLKVLIKNEAIKKIKREDHYKGLDMNYLKLANVYKVSFTKEIAYDNDYVSIKLNNLNENTFEDVLFFNFDKKYLKLILPTRKYKKYTKTMKLIKLKR